MTRGSGWRAGVRGELVRWHVLQTMPRQEKVLSRDLGAMKIEHFLPLREQVRSYGKRKLSSHLPLFPGYLFLRGTIEQAYVADRTQRVVRLIQVADQQQFHCELENIRLALSGGLALDPYPYLRAGIRVVVTRGPLKGLEGLIEDKPRPDRLILQIDLLGRAVSMEVDAAILEPVGFGDV